MNSNLKNKLFTYFLLICIGISLLFSVYQYIQLNKLTKQMNIQRQQIYKDYKKDRDSLMMIVDSNNEKIHQINNSINLLQTKLKQSKPIYYTMTSQQMYTYMKKIINKYKK